MSLLVLSTEVEAATKHEYHFHTTTNTVKDITFHTAQGLAIITLRGDGSLESYKEKNFHIEYDTNSEVTYAKVGSMEFIPDPIKPLVRCKDDIEDIDIEVLSQPKEDDIEITYVGKLYGVDVNVSYKYSERDVYVNRSISDCFDKMWAVSREVVRVAEFHKKLANQ